MIEVVPVQGRRMLDQFIRLPSRLNRADPSWIAPLVMERREALSPAKNPFFRNAEAAFWLVLRDGQPVGRISAQLDRRLQSGAEPIGHFGMIAAEDDAAVFAALFRAAEGWLAERGARKVQGPFNLSINEECGLLVDGFDTPPMLLMGHDPAYAAGQVERQGYAKAKDLYAYLYDTESPFPPGVGAMLRRPMPDGVRLRMVDLGRYGEEVELLTDIFNDAWSGNWGFLPLTDAETAHLAKSMRPLIVRQMVWFVEVKGEAAGFIVALPNLNAAIADLDGTLLPFGWAKLLWRLKVAGLETARVPLMGIRRSFARGWLASLLPFLLIDALRRAGSALGYRSIELSWVLEDNAPMRRLGEAIGGRVYKTYRIYEKTL